MYDKKSAHPLVPALFCEPDQKGRQVCRLCPFRCRLSEGKTGICKGKKNIGGTIYAVNYAKTASINIDPIEKKPLAHFYPSSTILSIGPNGCNLKCDFCQNFSISQFESQTSYLSPEMAVDLALKNKTIGIAYTYSEPLIWYEYVLHTARLAAQNGLVNVLVTNGTIEKEPLLFLLDFIDAVNLDIKSMDPLFYKKVCKGFLEPVLESAKIIHEKAHLEITNLMIPGFNDNDDNLIKLVDFIAGIDRSIPLHLSAYHPDYNCVAPATRPDQLYRAKQIADEKLDYIYVGNIYPSEADSTCCPGCGEILIQREGYRVMKNRLKENGSCPSCGYKTGIIMG